jgi:V8-like Glu-specific endopeptidase
MPGIPPSMLREMRRLLLTCPEFNTGLHLQTLFVDMRLQPFGSSLPIADNRQQNVDAAIAYLHNRYLRDGSNALVNLLTILAERYTDEYLGMQLSALADRSRILLSNVSLADAERYLIARSLTGTALESGETGYEQIIGISSLKNIIWLQIGLKAAQNVCRLLLDNGGLGTGFLVSRGLLLTNNHVLPTPQSAQNAIAEFNYQLDFKGVMKPTTRYQLDETQYKTNTALDYTLVHLKPDPAKKSLDEWGYSQVNTQADPIPGEHVSIIQHPGGEPKQIAMTDNYVKSISKPFIRYTTDTRPGSSGAPVYNDAWQVIALHHRSIDTFSAITGRTEKSNEGILLSQIRQDAGHFWPLMDESAE